MKRLPSIAEVCVNWAMLHYWGRGRSWSAGHGGGRQSMNSVDHALVDGVLLGFHGTALQAVMEHLRDVLEGRAESVADMRRWAKDVPISVWYEFAARCEQAIAECYRALVTEENVMA